MFYFISDLGVKDTTGEDLEQSSFNLVDKNGDGLVSSGGKSFMKQNKPHKVLCIYNTPLFCFRICQFFENAQRKRKKGGKWK